MVQNSVIAVNYYSLNCNKQHVLSKADLLDAIPDRVHLKAQHLIQRVRKMSVEQRIKKEI